jgi:hypothetical protein
MDYVLVGFFIVCGLAGLIACYVVWVSRRDAAGKSYGPDTAMGMGMSDIGRGASGPGPDAGPGSAGGDGSSS